MKPLHLLALLFTAMPGLVHAALNVFACEPEWGALATELGGESVKVYTATTAFQDPAPHRGAPQPDRADASRRSGRLHRCRTGNRLAAHAVAAIGQRSDPAGQTGIFRGCTPGCDAGQTGRPGSVARRRSCCGQSTHSNRPAQYCTGGTGPQCASDRNRSRPCHPVSNTTGRFQHPLECGDDTLANPGGTAQGNEYRGPAPGLSLTWRTGWG